MDKVDWDRLLETCIHRDGTDILLSPGASPLIRLAESWRSLDAPALDVPTIQVLASRHLGENPGGREDGYAYADFFHTEMGCHDPVESGAITRFRATAFNYPQTTVLLISLYASDRPGGVY